MNRSLSDWIPGGSAADRPSKEETKSEIECVRELKTDLRAAVSKFVRTAVDGDSYILASEVLWHASRMIQEADNIEGKLLEQAAEKSRPLS